MKALIIEDEKAAVRNLMALLGEADPDTIELGVPAVLYSRVITGPLSVLIAYAASIGLY
mgnify:CR=1 FL=1